jgi:hypothetical protein
MRPGRTRLAALFAALACALGAWGCSSDKCKVGDTRCGSNGIIEVCGDQGCGGGDVPEFSLCSGTHPDWAQANAACSPDGALANPCDGQQSICDGNAVQQCGDGGGTVTQCGSLQCIERSGCAFCGDGTEVPDPTCVAAESRTCLGNVMHSCACGLRTSELADCTASVDAGGAGEGGVCLNVPIAPDDAGRDVFCAYSAQTDPMCPLDRFDSYCDGDAGLAWCIDTYRVAGRAVACP